VPAGLGRDLLIIIGGAQAIVIGVPLALGFGVLVAVLVGILLIAGLVFVAVAKRR
jgi:Flp pilus assembly protein TadB